MVTISAGNEGLDGPAFFGSGSSGKNVLGVASVEAATLPGVPFKATITIDGASTVSTFGYYQYLDLDYKQWKMKDWPLVQLPGGADGCDPLPGRLRLHRPGAADSARPRFCLLPLEGAAKHV